MHGERHVGWGGGTDVVEHLHIAAGGGIHVHALRCVQRAFFFGAEFAPRGVVELQNAAAQVVERFNGLDVGGGDVGK